MDMVKECIAQIPADQRQRTLKQMSYPDTFVEEVDEEAAYSAAPGGDAIEGIVDGSSQITMMIVT
jgi:hypothetical protein